MRKIVITSLIALSALLSTDIVAQDKTIPTQTATNTNTLVQLPIGAQFPDAPDLFNVVSDGHTNLNTQYKDNGMLVVFTCNTCPYVVKAQQRTQEMIQLANNLNIAIVFVNSNEAQRDGVDSKDAMKTYAQEHKYEYYLIDENSQLANLFGASKTPEVFLFNKDRVLVYKGAMEDNPNDPSKSEIIYLKQAMEAMYGNVDFSPNATKSIGCSIKRKI